MRSYEHWSWTLPVCLVAAHTCHTRWISLCDMYTCMCALLLLKFCDKFLVPCIQLAVKALTNDEHQTADERGTLSCSDNITVCDSIARLFADWPQVHLVWGFLYCHGTSNKWCGERLSICLSLTKELLKLGSSCELRIRVAKRSLPSSVSHNAGEKTPCFCCWCS